MCTQSFLSRSLVFYPVLCILSSFVTFAQASPPLATANTVHEFPMILENNVVAGKTAVRTKIHAKLCVATLANGTVIPQNAVFSGEVIQSTPKTDSAPSRLTIMMNSVQWKNGSAIIKAYLTPWYYPVLSKAANQNLQYGPTQPANRTWNGEGQYPDPNSKVYQPFPSGGESDKSGVVPDATTSVTSSRRVPMKDIESEPSSDGGITIVSRKGNIKLNKTTTYVLATAELQLVPAKSEAAK
jgi:hypothetical protein